MTVHEFEAIRAALQDPSTDDRIIDRLIAEGVIDSEGRVLVICPDVEMMAEDSESHGGDVGAPPEPIRTNP